MGGEDFSEYSLLPDHSIPACMFDVGSVDPAKFAESLKPGAAPLPSLHSSKFAPIPEQTIRTGIVGMTAAVLDSDEEVILEKRELSRGRQLDRQIGWKID